MLPSFPGSGDNDKSHQSCTKACFFARFFLVLPKYVDVAEAVMKAQVKQVALILFKLEHK